MQEALLQFIWQYSLYRPDALLTNRGERVTVLQAGKLNTNAGPDFSAARVKLDNTTLIGDVELHIHTSDWNKHGHQHDAAYDKIILHVVLLNDLPIVEGDASVLELGPHIPAEVIERYTELLQTPKTIPCQGQLHRVSELTKEAWLNRMLVMRWERKLNEWSELLQQAQGDWRTLLYWRLAANMGFKVNAEAFLQTAQSLPAKIIGRHHDNLLQLEALLYGQAGMLEKNFTDDYPRRLKEEYNFLKAKYNLQPVSVYLWKFMRMRPANFPTIRLSQFAALLHKAGDLFTHLLSGDERQIEQLCQVHASSYWDTHYQLDGKETKATAKNLGDSSIQKLLTNTIAPVRFLYAHSLANADDSERALNWLSRLPAEENSISKLWDLAGWKAQNAAQGQGLLETFNEYCSIKKCLECSIGLSLIRSGPNK